MPNKEDSFELPKKYNSLALVTHGLAVEGTMRYLVRKTIDDEKKWGITGLLHNLEMKK